MYNENYIVCLNYTHESIILEYLADIQDIIDEITLKDENYDSFLNVLANIIINHNENGELAYKDTIFRNNWLYTLPSMVYWAALGYVSGFTNERGDIRIIATKLHNNLVLVNDKIGRMIISYHSINETNTDLN